jgi:hypothetical protein
MLYQFEINRVRMRGHLEPTQVAAMAAAGISLEIVRRRLFSRNTDRHVGEYTDGEAAALVADGWTQVRTLAEGEDVPPEPPVAPDPYLAWRDEHREGLAAFREGWDAAMAAMVATGTAMPALTFRDLKAKCVELGGDWPTRYRDVRDLYDEVVIAAGSLQAAWDVLPKVLADGTLGAKA